MRYFRIYAVFIFVLIIGMVLGLAQDPAPDYRDNAAKKNTSTDSISTKDNKPSDAEITDIFKKYVMPKAQAKKGKYIAFRVDDIGAFWSDDTAINVTEIFRAKKIPLVLGMIPVNRYNQKLDEDKVITSYVKSIKSDPSIEFALHGYNHETSEFKDISYDYADFKISNGIRILEKTTGMTPVTLIPPYNEYNNNTIAALKKEMNEYPVISSGYYDIIDNKAFTESDGILYMPQTTDIYDYEEDHLHSVDKIVNSCEYAISKYGTCVITIHHTRFAGSGTEIDAKKLDLLYSIIDWAKKKEEQGTIKIVRLKDMKPSDLR